MDHAAGGEGEEGGVFGEDRVGMSAWSCCPHTTSYPFKIPVIKFFIRVIKLLRIFL